MNEQTSSAATDANTVTIKPTFPSPIYVSALLNLSGVALAVGSVSLGLLLPTPWSGASVPGLVGAAVMLVVAGALTLLAASLARTSREHVCGRGFATRVFDMSATLDTVGAATPVVARLGVVQRWLPFARMHSIHAEVVLDKTSHLPAWFYADSRGRTIGSHGEHIAPRLTSSPSGALVHVAHVRGLLRIGVHGKRVATRANAIWACEVLEELLRLSWDEPARGFRDTGREERADELDALARRLDLRATDGASPWTTFEQFMSVWLAEDPLAPPDPRGLPPPVEPVATAAVPTQPGLQPPKIVSPIRWHLWVAAIPMGLGGACAVFVFIWVMGFPGTWVEAMGPLFGAAFLLLWTLVLASAGLRLRFVEYTTGKPRSRVRRSRVELPPTGDGGAALVADFRILRRWHWRAALHSLSAEVPLSPAEGQPVFYLDNRGRSCGQVAERLASLLDPDGPQTLLMCNGSVLRLAIHGGPTDQASFECACRDLVRVLNQLRRDACERVCAQAFAPTIREVEELSERFKIVAGPYWSALSDFERQRRGWAEVDEMVAESRRSQTVNAGNGEVVRGS